MPKRPKDKARKETDKELEKIKKKLREIYSEAEKELTKKANDYLEQFKEQDNVKSKLVKEGKLKRSEYIRWRKDKIAMNKHWRNMKRTASLNLHNTNKIANDYINGRLPDVFTTVYGIRADELQKEVPQISFEIRSPKAIKNLTLACGKSFLPYKKLGIDDIPWNMKRINSQVLQGIIQGESMEQIAERLISVCNNNEVAAMRTARTLVNTVENQARYEVAKDAADMGVIEVKMWDSSHDGRVREWHSDADSDYGAESQAIPMDEPFIVMGEKMMYPGDRAGSPENVYNCRCALLTKVVGFKSILPEKYRGAIEVK